MIINTRVSASTTRNENALSVAPNYSAPVRTRELCDPPIHSRTPVYMILTSFRSLDENTSVSHQTASRWDCRAQ
ncbi:unnamed protein product [Dicrocoelium dendriticum]|nr:unnamed protein product [Dicrocoelium dendriticum]